MANAENYWASSVDGPTYRDSWSSRYYRRYYYRNEGCDTYGLNYRVGVKFIRISDGADLYRYFAYGCATSGNVPWGTCRYALVANGGTIEWEDLDGNGYHNGSC